MDYWLNNWTMNSLRTFIAIDIPTGDELRKSWERIKESHVRDHIKWVDPRILHLTLFFLGEIPFSKVDPIWNSVCQHLHSTSSFKITLKAMGTFGSVNNPKVIWVGLQPSEALSSLYIKVVDSLKPFGFIPDERGFNPHITLGRVKHVSSGMKLMQSISELRNTEFQESRVDKIIFYKSELMPQGPKYTILKHLSLG